MAVRDIAPGEILLVESEPTAWFLSWDKASTNCQHCCKAIQKQREDRMMMMNGIIDQICRQLFQVQASPIHYAPQEKPDLLTKLVSAVGFYFVENFKLDWALC